MGNVERTIRVRDTVELASVLSALCDAGLGFEVNRDSGSWLIVVRA